MSTDAENARVVVDAAERIEQIIASRDAAHAADVEQIRAHLTKRFVCDYCGTEHTSASALMYCCLEKDQD